MSDQRRPLTPEEIRLYQRLAEVLAPSEAAIVAEQLAAARILIRGDQHASFDLPPAVRRLEQDRSQAMTGSYDDTDGWPVDIILHAADGRLESVERYRTDAGPLLDTALPHPSDVRLMPSKHQLPS